MKNKIKKSYSACLVLMSGFLHYSKRVKSHFIFTGIMFLPAIFLILPHFVLAAPTVSGINGSVSHDATVVINGSGFGIKSPVAPLLWDNVDDRYSSIKENAVVPVGSNANCTGSDCPWGDLSASSLNQATFTLLNPRGKHKAKYSNRTTLHSGGNGVVGHENFPLVGNGKLYVSWMFYPDSSADRMSITSSFKFYRLTNDGGWGNGAAGAVIWEPNGGVAAYDFSDGFRIGAYATKNVIAQTWNRMETVVDNGSNPKPTISVAVNNQSGGSFISNSDSCNYGGCTIGSLRSNITGIYTIGADWTNWTDPNSNPSHYTETAPRGDFGEIYVDNTLARVEICNASTKTGSNHCEIQIPKTSWVDNQLQIEVNQGSFADGSSAYLYVLDSTGIANTNGFRITFGSSGSSDTTAPRNPTGLSVL